MTFLQFSILCIFPGIPIILLFGIVLWYHVGCPRQFVIMTSQSYKLCRALFSILHPPFSKSWIRHWTQCWVPNPTQWNKIACEFFHVTIDRSELSLLRQSPKAPFVTFCVRSSTKENGSGSDSTYEFLATITEVLRDQIYVVVRSEKRYLRLLTHFYYLFR